MSAHDNIHEFIAYDPLTGGLTWKVSLGRMAAGSPCGRTSDTGYLVVQFGGKKLKGHKIAWRLQTGLWPAFEIDHADLDRLNNRWSNLRAANRSHNTHNQRPISRDLPRGVVAHGKKFRAAITVDNQRHELGVYDDPNSAHEAYAEAAIRFHGEFARVA